MGEARHVLFGAPEAMLLRHLSYHCHHLRPLEPLRPDRQNGLGDQSRGPPLAILDQTGSGGHRLHRGRGVHVHSVQGLRASVQEVEGLQQDHRRPRRPRRNTQTAARDGGGEGARETEKTAAATK